MTNAHRVIPIGSTCRMIVAEQPANADDPWTTRSMISDFARVRAGSLLLVLGNRVDDIDPKSDWPGHDTLCMHDHYGLCWLPSASMEVLT